MEQQHQTVGELLKYWRQRRRLSQLGLALEAEISQRHLSFLEAGRSQPSRAMIMQLTERLGVPLRERNIILNAAGYAPCFPQRPLDGPELSVARDAIARILEGYLPHPALAVDRHWTLLTANNAISHLLTGIAPRLLEGRVNVLRLSLHPEGLAPRIINLGEWREHVFKRLDHEIEISADPVLAALKAELETFPSSPAAKPEPATGKRYQDIAVPIRLHSPAGPLSFISTTTIFGTAVDVTLAEVTIEAFLPADRETADAMAGLGATS